IARSVPTLPIPSSPWPEKAAGFFRCVRPAGSALQPVRSYSQPVRAPRTGRVEADLLGSGRLVGVFSSVALSGVVVRWRVVGVAACGTRAFLGGLMGELVYRSTGTIAAQSPPLPPSPVAAERDLPTVPTVSDRFQAVVKKVGPAVVAVDAVKPPPSSAGG